MVLFRLVVVAMWVLAFLAGHEMWTPNVHAVHSLPNTAVFEFPELDVAQPASEAAQPLVDVYGNELDQAVGEYRIDPGGDLYEQHAPDTALLKLGPAGV